jgi:hypothetical protein
MIAQASAGVDSTPCTSSARLRADFKARAKYFGAQEARCYAAPSRVWQFFGAGDSTTT